MSSSKVAATSARYVKVCVSDAVSISTYSPGHSRAIPHVSSTERNLASRFRVLEVTRPQNRPRELSSLNDVAVSLELAVIVVPNCLVSFA